MEEAIENAKRALILDHLGHRLDRSPVNGGSKAKATAREFKLIAKYL
jgi:uncharacterized protein